MNIEQLQDEIKTLTNKLVAAELAGDALESQLRESITVPRELFEMLIEYTIDLRGEWYWKKQETRIGYNKAYKELGKTITEAVAIRDKEESNTI